MIFSNPGCMYVIGKWEQISGHHTQLQKTSSVGDSGKFVVVITIIKFIIISIVIIIDRHHRHSYLRKSISCGQSGRALETQNAASQPPAGYVFAALNVNAAEPAQNAVLSRVFCVAQKS